MMCQMEKLMKQKKTAMMSSRMERIKKMTSLINTTKCMMTTPVMRMIECITGDLAI